MEATDRPTNILSRVATVENVIWHCSRYPAVSKRISLFGVKVLQNYVTVNYLFHIENHRSYHRSDELDSYVLCKT